MASCQTWTWLTQWSDCVAERRFHLICRRGWGLRNKRSVVFVFFGAFKGVELSGTVSVKSLKFTTVQIRSSKSCLPFQGDYKGYDDLEGFQHALKTMFLMMWNQAPGTPTGNHGLFHRYHIEAITLQGVKMKNSKKVYGYVDMGRSVHHNDFKGINQFPPAWGIKRRQWA